MNLDYSKYLFGNAQINDSESMNLMIWFKFMEGLKIPCGGYRHLALMLRQLLGQILTVKQIWSVIFS